MTGRGRRNFGAGVIENRWVDIVGRNQAIKPLAGSLETSERLCHCADMEDDSSDKPRAQQLTSYGEPLWVDILKTAGVALGTIAGMIFFGALLVLAIVAPWARESFDCSMWCVIGEEIRRFLGG